MKKWISVLDRMPPDHWSGLVITSARPDKPVFAHVSNERFREEFPFTDYFLGRWRESILTGDHMRKTAKITHWLETDEELFPPTNEIYAQNV